MPPASDRGGGDKTLWAIVEEATPDISRRNGNPFLRLRLSPGGYATCWAERLFEGLKIAAKYGERHRERVRLEIGWSDKPGPGGEPWMIVTGMGAAGCAAERSGHR